MAKKTYVTKKVIKDLKIVVLMFIGGLKKKNLDEN